MFTFHVVNMEVQSQTWLFEAVPIALLSPTRQAEISYKAVTHSHGGGGYKQMEFGADTTQTPIFS